MTVVGSDPGVYDFRSGDCERHGENIPFAKPYKSQQTPRCCECMEIDQMLTEANVPAGRAGPANSYTDDLVTYALEACRAVDFDLRGALFASILFFGNYNLALAAEINE